MRMKYIFPSRNTSENPWIQAAMLQEKSKQTLWETLKYKKQHFRKILANASENPYNYLNANCLNQIAVLNVYEMNKFQAETKQQHFWFKKTQ